MGAACGMGPPSTNVILKSISAAAISCATFVSSMLWTRAGDCPVFRGGLEGCSGAQEINAKGTNFRKKERT